ncbi:hypothetical protein J1N35_002272 [Gossypium stocksii]|uniref:Uncharacterized protein n=1 Tax=Gossypium stocksii TaxID=47602 RepID=A0A9D4ANA5_9ROSI|nr:hypothetical protein J1N35_002272 [Gossypium stocksii]
MGRQGGGDSIIVSSSIALLQQRFKQLQKDREKREEKELMKLLSESESASTRYQPNGLLYRQQQTRQDSSLLSLGLSLYGRRTMAIPTSSSTTTTRANDTSSTSKTFEIYDHVDTSLHL